MMLVKRSLEIMPIAILGSIVGAIITVQVNPSINMGDDK